MLSTERPGQFSKGHSKGSVPSIDNCWSFFLVWGDATAATDRLTYRQNANLTGRGGWTYTYDAQNRLITIDNMMGPTFTSVTTR